MKKIKNHLARLACAVAVSAAAALPAHAEFIALDSTRDSGNQAWTGALGMDFDVHAPIWITKLGAFVNSSTGFASPISVGIFDRVTGLLVGTSATLTTANTTVEGTGTNNRFFDIADFQLAVGTYSIVATGFGAAELNGNVGIGGTGPTVDNGGGLISFTGDARYDTNSALIYPTIPDGGPANRYDAGTFQYTAVPEPASITLAAIGLLGLGFSRRKKRV